MKDNKIEKSTVRDQIDLVKEPLRGMLLRGYSPASGRHRRLMALRADSIGEALRKLKVRSEDRFVPFSQWPWWLVGVFRYFDGWEVQKGAVWEDGWVMARDCDPALNKKEEHT